MWRCRLLLLLALGAFCSPQSAGEDSVNPEDISPRETTADNAQTAGEEGAKAEESSLPTPPQAFPPTPFATGNGATAGPVHRSDEGARASDELGGGSLDGECWADDQVPFIYLVTAFLKQRTLLPS